MNSITDATRAEIEKALTHLSSLFQDAIQQAGIVADPVDALTTAIVVMSVGMLRGYRPEEDGEALKARVLGAFEEGLRATTPAPVEEPK